MGRDKNDFGEELTALRNQLLEMGIATEELVRDAISALLNQDMALAADVIHRDDIVDALDIRIETTCLRLIAQRITCGADIRLVGAAMKIATDIERIADHAVDIAQVAQRMGGEAIYKPLVDVPRLADMTRRMLRNSLDAFVHEDLSQVSAVIAADDEADAIYARMRRELAAVLQRDPNSVIQASYLLFVAHYLERICDHCTNIAERVAFLITGERGD
jgi:phosphate transport system protein